MYTINDKELLFIAFISRIKFYILFSLVLIRKRSQENVICWLAGIISQAEMGGPLFPTILKIHLSSTSTSRKKTLIRYSVLDFLFTLKGTDVTDSFKVSNFTKLRNI